MRRFVLILAVAFVVGLVLAHSEDDATRQTRSCYDRVDTEQSTDSYWQALKGCE